MSKELEHAISILEAVRDGKEIQIHDYETECWVKWNSNYIGNLLNAMSNDCKFRIKPEFEKGDLVLVRNKGLSYWQLGVYVRQFDNGNYEIYHCHNMKGEPYDFDEWDLCKKYTGHEKG